MAPSDAFLLLVSSGGVPESIASEAARESGLDVHGLGVRLRGEGLVVAARGEAGRLASTQEALAKAGTPCAVVPAAEAQALPGVHVAGGVALAGDSVSLRVHGRPAGPPPGEPLLFVFGDLGRDDAHGASAPRSGDVLKQRILRATFPVIDVVWKGGRTRVPMRGMSFRDLPGAGFSVADNFLLLFQRLAEQSGGAILDSGFRGQDFPIEPLRGADEPLEGADRNKTLLFERYCAAAAIALARQLYPNAPVGELQTLEPRAGSSGPPSAVVFAKPLRPAAASPVPWIRQASPRGRAAWRLRRLVPFAPIFFFVGVRACLSGSPSSGGPSVLLAGGVLAAAGIALVVVGLVALRRRERLRAVPTSRIRSLAMGAAEVAGRVAPTASFTAPFSKTRCVWYRFEIDERSGEDDEGRRWAVVQRGSSGDVPFRVEDGSGSVLVQPAGARIEVEPSMTQLDKSRRVREWILAEGAFVYVSGYAHRRSVAEGISGGPDRDDVFVGSGSDGVLVISPRSHGEQEGRLGIQAALSFAGGVVSLLLAIVLLAS